MTSEGKMFGAAGLADTLQNVRKVAVFRALMLGDLLCSVPAFRGLRRRFPNAEISLIALPNAREFASRFSHYIDRLIEFPGFPGLPERQPALSELPSFLDRLQHENFDLMIQMHGSGELSNPIVSLFNAANVIGHYPRGRWKPGPAFVEYPDGGTETERCLSLLREAIGVSEPPNMEFPVTPHDRSEAAKVLHAAGIRTTRYVCIHPGAQLASRRWRPEGFAEVADRLAPMGYQVVMTGIESERPITQAVINNMKADAADLTGSTSLGGLAAIFENASVLITNDTGVSHIAAALHTPTVVAVLGSDDARWQPYSRIRRRVIKQDVDCRPCFHRDCPIGHPCSHTLQPEKIFNAAVELLLSCGRERMSGRMRRATKVI